MSRPISDAMLRVYERLELCSSIYQALDQSLQYGDINRIERECIDKIVSRWMGSMTEKALMNVTQKRLGFKKLIQRTKENEQLSVR